MASQTTKKIGLIAGAGEIPIYFARKASQNGTRLISVGFSDEIESNLSPYSEKSYSFGVGQPTKILDALKKNDVEELLILGKVDKSVIYKLQLPDLKFIKFFKNIMSHEDKTLLLGVIEELEKEGVRVLSQKDFLAEVYPPKGVLTKRKPTSKELEDIEFGLPIARKLADMEIGQTLIVKNKSVIAVEAFEGTDKAIQRGCELSKGNCVVIKVSRTNQDYRYDSPGIGPQTVKTLIEGGASVLAIEADRVMAVEQEQVVKIANDAKLTVTCV
ncbi:MAG: UDP-2,3-diacylglucosamine diphosphatase LpxI [Nitrospinota bacterium]